ncbi:MAG: peptide deformylase [Bacteroidia bacterium]|nr:peptide deformylase [Bacteroidia bacterium]
MILSIVGYGHPTLRKKASPVNPDYPGLQKLIANMFETMYKAHGVGLAAPQVNESVRVFIIDSTPMVDEPEEGQEPETPVKKVFINARILSETGTEWGFNEGCLSIPEVREEVKRKDTIVIHYFDENFQEKTETYNGIVARIIQHEYDHIEGILFIDRISAFRRQLLKNRLLRIQKGDIRTGYPMKFANVTKVK